VHGATIKEVGKRHGRYSFGQLFENSILTEKVLGLFVI